MPQAKRRRRIRSTAFAAPSSSGGGRSRRLSPGSRVLLGIAPGLLYLAHLTFGANQAGAAQWLTVGLALMLGGALAVPGLRDGLFDLKPVRAPAALFALTIGIAALTLTSLTPGGAHPIWAWAGLPGASTVNRTATLLEIFKLLGLACVFVVGCLSAARADRARGVVEMVLGLGAAYAAISLLTFLAGMQVATGSRLTGGFLTANSGATVFGVLAVIGAGDLSGRWRRTAGRDLATRLTATAGSIAAMLLFTTCLLLTASRMGVLATAAAAGVLLLWDAMETRGRRLPTLAAGGVMLATALAVILAGNDHLLRRMEGAGQDFAGRLDLFGAHWDAFLMSPLFGWGLGTFSDINSYIMRADTYEALWRVRAAHNVYIQWLEEAGVVGAAPMFALIALVIGVSFWRSSRVRSGKAAMRGLVAANLVVLIHGTSDYALQTPSIAAFWAFLLGVQFAFGQSRT